MKPEAIIPNNPQLAGMAFMVNELQFTSQGHSLGLSLISPGWNGKDQPRPKFPLLVFLQGSSWTKPDRFYQLPQLCSYAQRGLAVASISHRNCLDGHPFPAYLVDAKAAIRFLRSQADQLGLDASRVAFMGTSSGGNTALLVGLTGDDPRYQTADYPGYSDAVSAVVDCFGPTDMLEYEGSNLPALLQSGIQLDALENLSRSPGVEAEVLQIMLALNGRQDLIQVATAMSPFRQVQDHKAYPPFLLMQGDRDAMVPLSQTEKMQARLLDAGASSRFIQVSGAGHEGSFWSAQVHSLIFDFLKTHLM